LADWTGIVLNQPDFNVNLSGTWAAPRGQIQLRAQAIQFQRIKQDIPKLEKLQLSVQLERERAQISEGQVLVQEQPVILTGEIPLGESFWEGFKNKQLPDWKKASARLRIEDAQLAPFSPLLPKVLAPQGKLTLNVVLAPGGKLYGELSLEKARTRPLATLGPIRDIDTKMRFRERTFHLESATAMIGGASVVAAGQADFRGTDWLKGEVPPFQFKLQG